MGKVRKSEAAYAAHADAKWGRGAAWAGGLGWVARRLRGTPSSEKGNAADRDGKSC